MLNDQLKLMHNTAGSAVAVSAVDWSQPRKSVRRSSDGTTTLTISSQPTAENKGYDTTRYSLRLDQVWNDPISYPVNPKVKLAAQIMISIPDRADAVDNAVTLVAQLLNLLVVGESLTDGDGKIDPGDISATLLRIQSGEL
jgi:hypothetical protein